MAELLNEIMPIMSFCRDCTNLVMSRLAAADLVSPTVVSVEPEKGSSILALLSSTNPICAPTPIRSTSC